MKKEIKEILTEVMSASKNRDWAKEAHATRKELAIMRKNNDNDFSEAAKKLLSLFNQWLEENLPTEAYFTTGQKWKEYTNGYNSCLKEIKDNLLIKKAE